MTLLFSSTGTSSTPYLRMQLRAAGTSQRINVVKIVSKLAFQLACQQKKQMNTANRDTGSTDIPAPRDIPANNPAENSNR